MSLEKEIGSRIVYMCLAVAAASIRKGPLCEEIIFIIKTVFTKKSPIVYDFVFIKLALVPLKMNIGSFIK